MQFNPHCDTFLKPLKDGHSFFLVWLRVFLVLVLLGSVQVYSDYQILEVLHTFLSNFLFLHQSLTLQWIGNVIREAIKKPIESVIIIIARQNPPFFF